MIKFISKKICLALPFDLYFAIVYIDFYFNINIKSTYAGKYYTLMCFHLERKCWCEWKEIYDRKRLGLWMKHKGSMDLPLVGREGLFDNGCFLGEVVTWMEDVSYVQPHVH